jgi:type I restriction enzyme S subunit
VEVKHIAEKPKYGLTDSAKENGKYKFLRITDISDEGVNWAQVPFCSCSKDDFEKYKLEHNDIVFARIGATTGKSFIVKNPNISVYASYLIKVKAKSINPDFLYQYFQTNQYWQQIDANKKSNLKGGVNGTILSKLKVPLPNKIEQEQVVSKMNMLDESIFFRRKRRGLLNALFKSLLNQLMTGQLRVDDIDFPNMEVD